MRERWRIIPTMLPALWKIDWARQNLIRLQAESKEWFGGDHHTVTAEPDAHPQRRGQTAFFVEAEPLPPNFGLLIGDCLQQMRAGLDHIAFALASRYTNPLPDEIAEASEFPIFGDDSSKGLPGTGSDRFRESSKKGIPTPRSGLAKIAGIDPAAQAIIEGLQPYHRGTDYRNDPLWRLHELSRIDKHRLLHVVVADFDGVAIVPAPGQDVHIGPGVVVANAAVVKGRTFVASLPLVGLTPAQQVNMKGLAPLKVAFGKGVPLVGGQAILPALGAIYDHIQQRVIPLLAPFLS